MKYLIAEHNSDFEEVSKEMYMFYQNKAGYYIGGEIMPSFFDPQHDLKGMVKNG